MAPIFTCQQCLKVFSPEKSLYSKVYEGQSLCVMCRKANGQKVFTHDENMCLFGEEAIANKKIDS